MLSTLNTNANTSNVCVPFNIMLWFSMFNVTDNVMEKVTNNSNYNVFTVRKDTKKISPPHHEFRVTFFHYIKRGGRFFSVL